MKKILLIIIIAFVSASSASAQTTTITGRVTDARTGDPLIGSTIVPTTGNELGTVADLDGNFTLKTKVKLPLTLLIQFVS